MNTTDRSSFLAKQHTIIVKVGSRVLSAADGGLDLHRIDNLAEQLSWLSGTGKQVVLVSSGAVAAGMGKLGLKKRPADIARLQAVASVGQAHLIQAYEKKLSQLGHHAAQVLLTADDLDDRKRYLNVRNTLQALVDLGAIPIINENDSVSVDELLTTFGDNDRLAAMVAGLFTRPALIILSDVEGVYDQNPNAPDAGRPTPPTVLPTIEQVDESTLQLASGTAASKATSISKGGMLSKLKAAQFVTRSGSPVIIASGRTDNVLIRLMQGETLGTFFLPQSRGLSPRKRWIGFTAQVSGAIHCDAGATQAIKTQGPSLLAIGIATIQGSFEKGDVVSICDEHGREFARGLTNYDDRELKQICGLRSEAIAQVLGHCPYEEVIHRDNITLM
ncbi:MAG: glutamate 5-kinase [bacterium]|nr:glutamate 5-kinase [bacterium]